MSKTQIDKLYGTAWRLPVAGSILGGMLASSPLCDRTKIDREKWVKIALDWADILIKTSRGD
jgi:hypothetical protein